MTDEQPKLKEHTVYTYYYPKSEEQAELFLAYTRYERPAPAQKIYKVEAKNGTEAKKIALRMRKEFERNNRSEVKGE